MATFQEFLQNKNNPVTQKTQQTAQPTQGGFQQFASARTVTKRNTIPYWERNGLIQSMLAPAYRLGQQFAMGQPENKALVQSAEQSRKETIDIISKQLADNPNLSTTQKERLGKILDDDPLGEIPLPRTPEEIAGDVLQTVALVTPFGISKGLISNTALRLGTEGAVAGSIFGLGNAMSEKKDPLLGALQGAAFGSASLGMLGLAGMGANKVMQKVFSNSNLRTKFIESVGVRLKKFGKEGEEIVNNISTVDNKSANELGQFLVKTNDIGIKNIPLKEKFNISATLDGKIVNKELPQNIQNAIRFYKEELSQVAERAKADQLTIRTPEGRIYDWNPRENYYPHRTDFEKLKNSKAYTDDNVLAGSVNDGTFKDIEEARDALKIFLEAHEAGEKNLKNTFWVKYLVKNNKTSVQFTEKEVAAIESGQIPRSGELANRVRTATDEAVGDASRFFHQSRIRKVGNLEKQRGMFNPFYDRDPESAILGYMNEAIPRLNKEEVFGKITSTGNRVSADDNISRIIGRGRQRIADNGGKNTADQLKEFNYLIDAAFNNIKQAPKSEAISSLLRVLSVPKLAFSAPINLGQGFLNPLLKTSPLLVLRGYSKVFTKQGWRTALETGTTLESTINEQLIRLGEHSFASKFLKWVGFTFTERVNRVASANIGIDVARSLTHRLLKDPSNRLVRARLLELGLEPEEILMRGMLNPQELSRAALRFTEQTQFRSRPIDLPLFANSPIGKLFFQFKSFSYNQTKLLKDEFMFEVKNKAFGAATKNMLVVSSIFPMTGEVLADIQSLASGSKRPTNALERYFDSLSRGGGLGLMADFTEATIDGKLAEFLLGPTLSSGTQLASTIVDDIRNGRITDYQKRLIIGQLGVTRPIGNYAFPTKNKDYENFFTTLKDFLNEQ